MASDVVVAESSPAPVALPNLASMSREEMTTWRTTGDVPSVNPADPPPAEPEGQAASTEASSSADSEPAKGKGVKARNAELETEIARLQEQLQTRARLRRELSKPEPTTDAKPTVSSSSTDEFPAFEQWSNDHPDGTYDAYARAAARHEAERLYAAKESERERRQQEQTQHETRQSRAQTFQQRYAEAAQADPTLAEKLGPLTRLTPTDFLDPGDPVGPENVIAQEVMESERGLQMAVYLSEHPDEFARLVAMTSPADLMRALGRIDARLESTPAPVGKTVTNAPPPPPSVSSRMASPADDLEAALASGDFRRYKQIANARDAQRHGR